MNRTSQDEHVTETDKVKPFCKFRDAYNDQHTYGD